MFHIPKRSYIISPAKWLYHLEHHLFGTPSAKYHTTNGAMCGKYNFGKYNLFYRPDEAMLFVMVKACL